LPLLWRNSLSLTPSFLLQAAGGQLLTLLAGEDPFPMVTSNIIGDVVVTTDFYEVLLAAKPISVIILIDVTVVYIVRVRANPTSIMEFYHVVLSQSVSKNREVVVLGLIMFRFVNALNGIAIGSFDCIL
jgi:hypothetical protein